MKKLISLLSALIISGFVMPAYSQHHDAAYVYLDGRTATMDFTIPENIESNGDFTLTMTLYDQNNNKKFEHVSTQLAVFKKGVTNPLMNVLFYDKNGEIVIDFKHQSFDKIKAIVQAPQETFLGGYMGEYGGHIKVLQNVFSEDGSYMLEATVISIDNPRAFLDPQIKFTKEIHIGEAAQADNMKIMIPDWVRSNAKWWSEGSIGDNDFAAGIQFMIKNGIIKIPTTENAQVNQNIKIPDWVRSNAKWWSEGSIGDNDFAAGIQHLIKVGIIKV